MPTLNSHTHCQAALNSRAIQSLSKSVSEPTRKEKIKARKHNKVYSAYPAGYAPYTGRYA